MNRTNYFKGYIPIYSLSFAEEIMKRGYCPNKIVRNKNNKELFIFLFKKNFELYNLVRELKEKAKSKHDKMIKEG